VTVKVCGITNPGDAMACVESGVTVIGFNFHPPSPRYIPPEVAARISMSLPPGILKAGVFVDRSAAFVCEVAARVGLEIAQLHGDESPDQAPPDIQVWKTFHAGEEFSPALLNAFPAYAYLLDTPSEHYGGSGRTFDWASARVAGRRIVVAGGLGPDNVARAIRIARPWGVDACSRLESSPGRKDPARIREFVRRARQAWESLQQ
jgi:phosphoribosylanthranilate isomerase